MRFWKRSEQNATGRGGAADDDGVEYSAVALTVQREGVGYRLEIDLTLSAARGSADSPLVLALNNCPFEVRTVNSGAHVGSRVVSTGGREHILLEPEPEQGWNNQVVRVLSYWRPVDGGARATHTPWVIAPDMLPTPILVDSPGAVRTATPQPMVRFAEELPSELDGAGIGFARETGNEPTVELLQSVMFPRTFLREPRDDAQFAFISTDSHRDTRLNGARALLADMIAFLAATLGVQPAARICVALADDPFRGVVAPGALLAMRPDWLGLTPDGRRYEHLVVRMLTGVWWGSGCRIRGEDSLPICIAIGGAMGLLWLESRGASNAVERLLAKHRAPPLADVTSSTTGTLQVNALTTAFYRALRDPSTASNFRRMTGECWAQSLTEDVWLRRLHGCGIVLPNVLLGGGMTAT